MSKRNIRSVLGPGLLYAGAAVGVSHLVQSTRAGAGYGFDLLWILILANIIKYPFFEFGSRYAAATGNNLITGYSRIGKWAVILFAVLTLSTMFSVQAAVTIVTAGLAANVTGVELDPVGISAMILIGTMVILMIGRFAVLDKLIKLVIIMLTASTFVAVFSALAKGYEPDPLLANDFTWGRLSDMFFLIAFVGWMPAPLDVTVWQSLWTVEKGKNLKFRPKIREVLVDFKVGYIGTAILAVCFLTLGAYVMHGSGRDLSSTGVIFADQLLEMYTENIGRWSYYIIAIAALTTMFSTTLTCLDAYPRVMKPLTHILFPKIRQGGHETWIWLIVVVAGSLAVMTLLSSTMGIMVDIATTLSFITAPLLAVLNYRVVTDKHMPEESRPGMWLRIYAWAGTAFLGLFTLVYLFWRFLF